MNKERTADLVTQQGYFTDKLSPLLKRKRVVGERMAIELEALVRSKTFGAIPHLGIGIIFSELSSLGWNVRIHDLDRVKKNPRGFARDTQNSDLIGISVMDIGLDAARKLLQKLDPAKVVVGGPGATFGKEVIRQAHPEATIVVGEGEGLIKHLVEHLQTRGYMEPEYTRDSLVDFVENQESPCLDPRYSYRQLPLFRRAIFQVLEVSRGCHEACNFCPSGQRPVAVKPLSTVSKELKLMPTGPGRVLFFIDQNLCSCSEDYLIDLFTMVNRSNTWWIGEGTITDIIDNEELMRLMAKNCLSFLVGAEDLFNPLVGSRSKNKLQDNFDEYTQRLRRFKIPVIYSLIVGLDNQDLSIFESTARKVLELGITPWVHVATPLTGTQWHSTLSQQGRIVNDGHRLKDMRFHQQPVFEPKQMTHRDLMAGLIWLENTLFSVGQIAHRFAKNTRDCGPRYALSLLPSELMNHVNAQRLTKKRPDLFKEGMTRFKL